MRELETAFDPSPRGAKRLMQEIVEQLNPTVVRFRRRGTPLQTRDLRLWEAQNCLRELVRRWVDSGPNLRKMFAQDPELQRRANEGRTILYAAPNGRGYLEWTPLIVRRNEVETPQDVAFGYFMMLITNPEWHTLSGPCSRCDKYFLRRRRGKRVYCSKTCSSHATALTSVQKRRKREHNEKLKRARTAIKNWQMTSRRTDWKRWVCQDVVFTPRWLTRAVNSGQLIPPS